MDGGLGLKAVMEPGQLQRLGRTSSRGRLGKGWERERLSRVWGALSPLERRSEQRQWVHWSESRWRDA